MSAGISPQRQHFDNLSYISDGRERVSYVNDPYAASFHHSARDGNAVILRPGELNRYNAERNPTYSYRSGQDQLHGYNNAAFSDITGGDSRGPSVRSQPNNLYKLQETFGKSQSERKASRICSKYWYIFVLLVVIILVGIGLGVGLGVHFSRSKKECDLSCDPSERVVQLNATHCECQFDNQCEYQPPVCGQHPCHKFNGTGYECLCAPGFQHPPATHNLTHCEDIDECATADACDEHQLCNNTEGNYTCSCKPGYMTIIGANAIRCQDIDECMDGVRCINGECVNSNGSFTCVCHPGYALDPFHPLYCEDIDECDSSANCTGVNEVCRNTPGSFQCVCAPGYRRDEHGHCQNVNECAESTTTCDSNSRCEDRNGTFACCIKTIANECIECGYDYSNSSATVNNHVRHARMINGEPVEAGYFPWIAALLIKREYYDSEPRYVCSASLVSSWNLVTAAHCLDEQHFRKQWELTHEPTSFHDIFDIRIGVHNLSLNSTDFIQSHSYSIANFTLHKDYEPLGNENALVRDDVALIRLTTRIQRSSTTDWLCMPPSSGVADQQMLKVVSYGNANEHLIQQQMNIHVLDNQASRGECQRQLDVIAHDAFCAISSTNTSLLGVGDSGAGAVALSDHRRWQLAGVMSKTGLQKAYSAMTNVSRHLEWLHSLIER